MPFGKGKFSGKRRMFLTHWKATRDKTSAAVLQELASWQAGVKRSLREEITVRWVAKGGTGSLPVL